jgi:hypothetical protein
VQCGSCDHGSEAGAGPTGIMRGARELATTGAHEWIRRRDQLHCAHMVGSCFLDEKPLTMAGRPSKLFDPFPWATSRRREQRERLLTMVSIGT